MIRSIQTALILVFSALSFAQAQEVTSTLVDDAAILDVTIVTEEESTRAVIIREAAIQEAFVPQISTRNPKPKLDDQEATSALLPSVDTLSGAELKTFQHYDIKDTLSQSAGVSVVQTGQAGSTTSLFIRGMESNHTVVMLNGRRLPPGLAGLHQIEFLDTANLESIQLHKGAVSSLYGSDALSGAIDLRSTDARYVQANTLSTYFEGGSFSTFRSGQKVTLRDGRVGIALDTSYHETENDRVQSDFENQSFRGNVAYEIGDGIYLDVLGYIQDGEVQVPGSSLGFGFPEEQLNKNQSSLFSPRLSIQRDDWDFSTFYSYTENELEATRSPFFNDNLLEQFGHEAEAVFNYHPTKEATYTLGAGYYGYEFERTPITPGFFNQPAQFEYGYTSAFAQADIALPHGFQVLTSGRYDDHDSFESKGTYSAQLSHHTESTGTTFFGKVATGYKAPSGQDFIFIDPTIDPTTIPPEESATWEVGVQQRIINKRSSIALTYFQSDVENLVDIDPVTFFLPSIVDTETSGVEVEFNYGPRDNLDFYTNYTFLDAEIVSGQYFGGFQGGPGDRLPRRPRHQLGAGVVTHGDKWTLGTEVTGSYDRLDSPRVTLSDYTVARIFGSLEVSDNVELYGRVENVFDDPFTTTTGYSAAGLGAFGGVRIVIGR